MMEVKTLFNESTKNVLKIIWNKCSLKEEMTLARHRENCETKLNKLNLPWTILPALKDELHLIELAYNDALSWINIYENELRSLKYHKINLCYGKYSVINFITEGKFDDKKFVSLFVKDQFIDILDRFYLSCCYCLGDVSDKLFNAISNQERKLKLFRNDLATKEIFAGTWLDYQASAQPTTDFLLECLTKAVENGHERAMEFFWEKNSETVRLNFCDQYFRYYIQETETVRSFRIVNFLYSQLNTMQQVRCLEGNIAMSMFFKYYMLPTLVSFLPEQLKTQQANLNGPVYCEILHHLACKIKEIKSPIYQEIFHKVWNLGSDENKNYFHRNGSDTIVVLFKAKKLTDLSYIIKQSSSENKRQLLISIVVKSIYKDSPCISKYSDIQELLNLFILDETNHNQKKFSMDSISLLTGLREILKMYEKQTERGNQNKKLKTTAHVFLSAVENLLPEIILSLESMYTKPE